MRATVFLVVVVVLGLGSGCQESQRLDYVRIEQTSITLDAALTLADERAAGALAKADTQPVAPDEKTAHDPHWLFQQEQRRAAGDVLTLADYQRSVQVYTQDNRPVMSVLYTCRKELGYLGGWTHFAVWVFLDTGQTRWFGGR